MAERILHDLPQRVHVETVGNRTHVFGGENTAEARRQRMLAESAAAVALAAGGAGEYASTAAGLAATDETELFWVDQADGTGIVYRHDAGPVATEIRSFVIDMEAALALKVPVADLASDAGFSHIKGKLAAAGAYGHTLALMLTAGMLSIGVSVLQFIDAAATVDIDGVPANLIEAIGAGTLEYDDATHRAACDEALQAATDHVSTVLGGGQVNIPQGVLVAGDVVWKKGVSYAGVGQIAPGYRASSPTTKSVIQQAAGSTWIFDTSASAAQYGMGLSGVDFQGLGSGPVAGALRLRSGVTRARIENCHFFNFGGSAIKNEGVGNWLVDLHGVAILLNRTQAALIGAIDNSAATDTWVIDCEMNLSLGSGEGENGVVNITSLDTFTGDISTTSKAITNASSTLNVAQGRVIAGTGIPVGARIVSVSGSTINLDVFPTASTTGVTLTPRRPDLFLTGILLGANDKCFGCMGSFCERGIHSLFASARINGGTADRCPGHGFSGVGQFANCQAQDASFYADGLWDGFNFDGTQGGQATGCESVQIGANGPRYGCSVLGGWGSLSSRWQIRPFESKGHSIAPFLNDPTLPHDVEGSRHLKIGTGTTADVTGVSVYVPTDGSPVSFTGFTGGDFGQEVLIRGNSNLTMVHSSNWVLPGGVNFTMANGPFYRFCHDTGDVWRYEGAIGALDATLAGLAGKSTTGSGNIVLATSPTIATLLTISGTAPTLHINGSSMSLIQLGSAGAAAPTFTSRSAGAKLVLYPALTGAAVDYGIGVEGGAIWLSTPTATSSHAINFYGGTTKIGSLRGDGLLSIEGPIKPKSYTVGTVPSASGMGAGAQIYVSNESGGATGAESDGTNWRRYADRAVIS